MYVCVCVCVCVCVSACACVFTLLFVCLGTAICVRVSTPGHEFFSSVILSFSHLSFIVKCLMRWCICSRLSKDLKHYGITCVTAKLSNAALLAFSTANNKSNSHARGSKDKNQRLKPEICALHEVHAGS